MGPSRLFLTSFSRQVVSSTVPSSLPQHLRGLSPLFQRSVYFFSDDKGPKKEGIKAESSRKKGDDDPFGVDFEDGADIGKLGPKFPPKYKRDAITGKFSLEEESELSPKEKRLLKMDPIEEQNYLMEQFTADWDETIKDDESGARRVSNLAQRIRQDNMGVNTLGRSVAAQSKQGKTKDGETVHKDRARFSKPLSPSEFKVFQKHMKDEYKTDVDEGDIPVESTFPGDNSLSEYADNEYLNTKWMTSKALRFMDGAKDDDPFSDLMPSDLNPSRLVNRKNAKPIPKQLLHHNNLSLLRRYITPAGQIMNREQSRLGAKDQRKIAKLIKRARHLGLIPHEGQFAVELHGNVKEKDIDQEKDWENELSRRGLVIARNKNVSKEN